MSMTSGGTPSITLPPGVTIAGQRETSQANVAGQIVQGINFTLALPTGATTSIFVPYSVLGNTDLVAQAFNERIAQINAVHDLVNG
jgi:hypothetical protein